MKKRQFSYFMSQRFTPRTSKSSMARRNFSILIIILIALAATGAVYLFNDYDIKFAPQTKCTDTDATPTSPYPSGLNYFLRGTVNNRYTDYCLDNFNLREYYCSYLTPGPTPGNTAPENTTPSPIVPPGIVEPSESEVRQKSQEPVFNQEIKFSPPQTPQISNVGSVDINCQDLGDYICREGACVPRCLPDTIVHDRDPYFYENTSNPKWVWVLRNLDQNQPTEINSSTDITGPLIGIANNFVANSLDDEDILKEPPANLNWWNNFSNSWVLPENHLALTFTNVYPTEAVYEQDKGKLETTIKYEQIDTTQAIGVPAEYQQYLLPAAGVVSITTRAMNLSPTNYIPSIFLNYQHRFISLWANNIWADDGNYTDYIQYYATLENVIENNSLEFLKTKMDCTETQRWWVNCTFTDIRSFILPLNQETPFYDQIIYNYINQYYPQPIWGDENYKEWAIVYVRNNNTQRTNITPTSYLVFQTAYFNGSLLTMTFYKDPYTNDLIYLPEQNWYQWIDFYYKRVYISKVYTPANLTRAFFGLKIEEPLWYWPGFEYNTHNLLINFGLDPGGRISMLGEMFAVAEPDEFVHYFSGYSVPDTAQIPLGTKNINLRTAGGTKIGKPALNSLNNEEKIYLFSGTSYADIYLRHYVKNEWGGWWRGFSHGVPLKENAFTFNGDSWYPPWKFNNLTVLYSDWRNPLRLVRENIQYSGEIITGMENLVFGTNTPRVETSLTSGKDEYTDKVYIETQSATPANASTTLDLESVEPGYTQTINLLGDEYIVELVSASDTAATIKLTNGDGSSEIEEINEGESKKLLDLIVFLEMVDENNLNFSAVIIISKEFPNSGIKYIYSFETPVDLTQLSEQNKIKMTFLSGWPELIGYVSPTAVKIRPYCAPLCGNRIVEEPEQCDMNNLNGQTCASLGLGGGELNCYPPESWDECTFDTSQCTCGNGEIDEGEECDGRNLNGETCESLGFDGGYLQCGRTCGFDTSGCFNTICGNNVVEGNEECDDGNRRSCDGCNSECESESNLFCGDGTCCWDAPNQRVEDTGNCPADCETSFLFGTKVLLTGNKVKSIENILVGDLILSFNEKTKQLESSKVSQALKHNVNRGYLIINGKLKVTPNHPMLVNGKWGEIGNAKVGDVIQTINGAGMITLIETAENSGPFYDLEVEGNHNYFADGFLVHNKPPIECPLTCDGYQTESDCNADLCHVAPPGAWCSWFERERRCVAVI